MYSTLFRLSPQSMWVCEEDTFRFIQVNQAAIKLYGFTESEFLAMTILDMSPAEDKDKLKKFLQGNAHQRSTLNNTLNGDSFRHVKKDGKTINVDLYSSPVKIKGVQCRSVIGIDVTEKLLLEEKLLNQKLEEHQKISKAVIQAQEVERKGIGEELHDNVNQLLAAASLYIDTIVEQPENVVFSVMKTKEYIASALVEIRKLSHALVGRTKNEEFSLKHSIDELIKNITATRNIKVNFNILNFSERHIKQDLKLVLYRIVQEQFTNILKHSEATGIEIQLTNNNSHLTLMISDNGKGFNTLSENEGIGLRNIKNRTRLYNGKVDIISSPGSGCKVIIDFTF